MNVGILPVGIWVTASVTAQVPSLLIFPLLSGGDGSGASRISERIYEIIRPSRHDSWN